MILLLVVTGLVLASAVWAYRTIASEVSAKTANAVLLMILVAGAAAWLLNAVEL